MPKFRACTSKMQSSRFEAACRRHTDNSVTDTVCKANSALGVSTRGAMNWLIIVPLLNTLRSGSFWGRFNRRRPSAARTPGGTHAAQSDGSRHDTKDERDDRTKEEEGAQET